MMVKVDALSLYADADFWMNAGLEDADSGSYMANGWKTIFQLCLELRCLQNNFIKNNDNKLFKI